MSHKDAIYGKFMAGTAPIPQAPSVDQILGAQVKHDSQGKPEQICIQYLNDGKPIELIVGFLDGMFLLSLLKSIQLDAGIPFPDDPRASKK